MIDPRHFPEAIEMFEIARRLLIENGVERIDIERRLWIKRQRNSLSNNVVVWWRPNGFSEPVLVVRDSDDPVPLIIRYATGAWRKILRKAAADFDVFKKESA